MRRSHRRPPFMAVGPGGDFGSELVDMSWFDDIQEDREITRIHFWRF